MKLGPLLIALSLTLVASAARVVPVVLHMNLLLNFAPLMAIAFCGGIYLPRLWAWLVPLSALLLSDVILNLYYHAAPLPLGMLASYGCYAVAIVLGSSLSRHPRWTSILAGVLVNSILFYLVTNSFAWLSNPVYPKDLAGWIQSLTLGDPRFAPTWTFFRQSLLSDLLYTVLFVGCMQLTQAKSAAHEQLDPLPISL